MTVFFITFFVLLLFVFMMSIGFIFGRKELKGSCGGLGKIMGNKCAFCEKRDQCKKQGA